MRNRETTIKKMSDGETQPTIKKMSDGEAQPTIKKILMIYTGGTIGQEKNDDGVYVPVPQVFLSKLKTIGALYDQDLFNKLYPDGGDPNQLVLPQVGNTIVQYQLKEYDPLLDSSNMGPNEWIKIGTDIQTNYNDFDAFIVLHGTDTMALTSSVLSFMIEKLDKTVIITGSQISIFEVRSDAVSNISAALLLSAFYEIPEVCLLFGNKLFRGNRATKVRLNKLNAFESPNYSILAKVEVNIEVFPTRIREPTSDFKIHTTLNRNVAILSVFPTITADLLRDVLKPLKGLVLQTYGAGNFPSNRSELLDVLKEAVQREVLIVNITLCLQGTVSGIYETGKVLDDAGVISGYDMTVEAAYTKLCVVLDYSDLSYAQRVERMKENTRGELTPANQ